MANLVFDFLHHYQTGERRASDPADAYQYDEGHVMEAVVPVEVTSCEIHYWVRGQEEAEAYVPESITQNEDGSYSIIGHIPNTYFETYGELRVYIVVTDGTASITTYEGRIHICERSKPDDYVDDDPENEATRVLNEAREAAATATAAAETCEEVLESIPEDYSQLSDDVSDLKDGLSDLEASMTETINSVYVTDTASGSIASFPDGADGVPVKSLTVDIEPVQSGSGDPSPTNIRPISGHTSAVVTRTGKNVLKPWITAQTKNGITYTVNTNGSFSTSGTASNNSQILSTRFVLPKGDYILNGCPVGGSIETYYLRILLYRGSSLVSSYSDIGNGVQFTVDDGMELITFVSINSGNTAPSSAWYPMIRPASDTDATFEPYTAETYTIDLDGTRYGGTLDVTTGVLTVDSAFVDLGTLDWTYYTSGTNPIFYAEPSGHRAYVNGEHTEAICENYAEGNPAAARSTLASGLPDKKFSWISGVSGSFTVRDSSYTSASDFKTAMNGVKLIYPLATPFTVQLTANELKTVLGQNNIWADTGDVEVEYRADTKLYIEKLTAPTEDDMIADHAISANTFFMIGNTLYRATTAIASGATITVGTNATRLSLSDALNTLS